MFRKLLRTLALKCPEVISGCHIEASAAVLDGTKCCKAVFRRMDFSLRGLCFSSDDFIRVSPPADFPVKR